jgi:hypothetical protein
MAASALRRALVPSLAITSLEAAVKIEARLSFVRCGGSVKFNRGAIKSQDKNCEAIQE